MVTLLSVCGSLQQRSANRAALEVAHRHLASLAVGGPFTLDEYGEVALLPPLDVDPDREPGPVVEGWRRRLGAADAVLVAAPEYGGGLAGTMKNALDWVVGTGELYGKPVAIISAGTSGGVFARRNLVQTLTWQGAHVVAQLGIAAPRTKADASGAFTEAATIEAIRALVDVLVAAPTMPADRRLALVRAIVSEAGVDAAHIAPV